MPEHPHVRIALRCDARWLAHHHPSHHRVKAIISCASVHSSCGVVADMRSALHNRLVLCRCVCYGDLCVTVGYDDESRRLWLALKVVVSGALDLGDAKCRPCAQYTRASE